MIANMPLVRAARRGLEAGAQPRPRWAEHGRMFEQALTIVRVYYVITMYLLYARAQPLYQLEGTTGGMDLMWPVFWLEHTGLALGGQILVHLFLVAGLLGALLWRSLAVRVLVSVALLMSMAEWSSHGFVHHSKHEWFWISVCFWFLPSGPVTEVARNRAGRMQFLLAFGAAPALILLFYTLSGVFKVWFAALALLQGEFGGFHPEAMATTVAGRGLQTGSAPLWAEVVIAYPLLGWPLYLGLYFVEVVAFAVFFRPALHRAWGVILILFHFGTLLFMDIPFPLHVLINGLLFVMSPFAPRRVPWREAAAAVPVFGVLFRARRGGAGRRVSDRGASAREA